MQNIQPGFSNINNIQNQNNINNINNYNINLHPRPINFQTTQHEINAPVTSPNILILKPKLFCISIII